MTTNVMFRITKLIVIVLVLFMQSCHKEYEPIFNNSADERARKALEDSRAAILSAENGWKGFIETGSGLNFVFYFDFQENGDVTMVTDFDTITSTTPGDGTYAMKALQRPTISFDTYTYIHLLTDPDASINGGVYGEGLNSDFEFAFDSEAAGVLFMEGIQRDTKMRMIQATAQEKAQFLNGDLGASVHHAIDFFEGSSLYYYLDNGSGEKLPLGVNRSTKTFTIFYLDTQLRIQKVTSSFTYSLNGILLDQTVTTPDFSFNELLWDETEGSYYILDGSNKIFLEGSVSPIEYTAAVPSPGEKLQTDFSSIVINPRIITNTPAGFQDRFFQTESDLDDTFGLTLGNVVIEFASSDVTSVGFELMDGTDLVYFGFYIYPTDISPTDVVSFTGVLDQNLNALATTTLSPLLDYFENNSFKLIYVADGNLGELLLKMVPEGDPSDFTYGILE